MTDKEALASNPRLEMAWQTYNLNKGFIGLEIAEVVRDAFVAAWHAGFAEPRPDETTGWELPPCKAGASCRTMSMIATMCEPCQVRFHRELADEIEAGLRQPSKAGD